MKQISEYPVNDANMVKETLWLEEKKVFELDGIALKILPESSYYLSQNKIKQNKINA